MEFTRCHKMGLAIDLVVYKTSNRASVLVARLILCRSSTDLQWSGVSNCFLRSILLLSGSCCPFICYLGVLVLLCSGGLVLSPLL